MFVKVLHSVLTLSSQRKFGNPSETRKEFSAYKKKRGLRASDSIRNTKESNLADSAIIDSTSNEKSILKASPSVKEQNPTPRRSMMPLPTGSSTSLCKRKVKVTFSNSPAVTRNIETKYIDEILNESIVDACTPSNSCRRVQCAGHTPGHPQMENLSDSSSESPICSHVQEDEMSNLISNFPQSVPVSPEVELCGSPCSDLKAESSCHEEHIFSGSMSTIGKPPTGPFQTKFQENNDISRDIHSFRDLTSSNNSNLHDSVTPSSLFYSSSESERFISEETEIHVNENVTLAYSNSTSLLDVKDSDLDLITIPCAQHSQPAPRFHQPSLDSSHGDSSAVANSQSMREESVMKPSTSTQDFCVSSISESKVSKTVAVIGDENNAKTEGFSSDRFLDDKSTHDTHLCLDSQNKVTRHRGSAPLSRSSCVGSPVLVAPKLSTCNYRKLRYHIEDADSQAAEIPQEIKSDTKNDLNFPCQENVEKIDPQHINTKNANKLENFPSRNREVSLSRPGLRKAGSQMDSCKLGLCLTSVEKKKSIPFMLASAISLEENLVSSTSTAIQQGCESTKSIHSFSLSSDHERENKNQECCVDNSSHASFNIDEVCAEALHEVQADNSSLMCGAPGDENAYLDISACLGLDDIMISAGDNTTHRKKLYGHSNLKLSGHKSTPFTVISSSGCSLGTTPASRIPAQGSYQENSESICEIGNELGTFSECDSMSQGGNVQHVSENLSLKDESFCSQATTTTVALDENSYEDRNYDFENTAQLCFTSRPLNMPKVSKIYKKQNLTEDIKEIVLHGKVGFTTAISISFRNKRSKGTTINASAILHRFEPSGVCDVESGMTQSDVFRAISNENLQDEEMNIAPDSRAQITVEFSPFGEGIYSGILKIRSKKKVCTVLS